MIGGLLIAVACGVVYGQPGLIWADLDGLGDTPLQLEEAGEYSVWAKVDAGGAGTLTIGAVTLEVAAESGGWIALGSKQFDSGTVTIEASGPITRIAMANVPGFDPRNVEPFLYVSDSAPLPRDARLDLVRDTDTRFAMTEFESRKEWESFASDLRRKLLVGCGLWPLPEKTPLNAVVEDFATHDDYIVSRVHFEGMPGFFVTGNLYRPVGDGPFPGVACPHGHWEHGRLEHGDRGSVPVRGITLARMGMVAFMYDMVGYNDSHQIDHHFDNWSEAERKRLELWGIHPFALQLWSSIRVVDFLQGLPYVDADNIACTGASGGGTQTFALTGVDDRVKVAAPVNMISHTMQGGCICENAPLIRFNASNMEVGALAAPRPLMMVSATGDWTKETPDVEYPAIRGIYELYDATDRVAMVQIDAPHNYNQDSREAVYHFFGKWVLGDEAKWATFEEPEATPEPVEQARVFSEEAQKQHDSADVIVARMIEERRMRAEASLPNDRESLKAYQSGVGQSLFDVTGVTLPAPGDVKAQNLGSVDCEGGTMEQLVLGREGDAIAGLLFKPEGAVRGSVLVVHTVGKLAFVDAKTGGPGELVSRLMADGLAVLAIDPFLIGESLSDGRERTYGKFPTTFMPTNTGYRIQDIVASLAYLRSREDLGAVRGVAGLGEAGIWCLFASALDGRVPNTVVDVNGFDPNDDEAWLNRHYLACVQSSGGVKAAAAMVAPRNLAVFNTSGGFDLSGVTEVFGDALTFGHDRWSAERIADQF